MGAIGARREDFRKDFRHSNLAAGPPKYFGVLHVLLARRIGGLCVTRLQNIVCGFYLPDAALLFVFTEAFVATISGKQIASTAGFVA